MPPRLELAQHAVEHVELASGAEQLDGVLLREEHLVLVGAVRRVQVVEEVRVVAHLPELHRAVLQRPPLPAVAERDRAPLRDLLVVVLLPVAHVALDDLRHLVGQLALDLGLFAAEEERADHLVQAVDDEEALLLRERHVVLLALEGRGEPLVEGPGALEDGGQDEVEERPKLVQVVLDGRPGEEHAVLEVVLPAEDLGELRLRVLQAVPLVDDDVLPADALQHRPVADDEVVVREDRVVRPILHEVVADVPALVAVAVVQNRLAPRLLLRQPPRKLVPPVGEHRLRRDDEERALVVLALHEIREERDGLDRLPEPHLVREDAVEVVDVERHHPLQAHELVRAQLPALEHRRLALHLLLAPVHGAVVLLLPEEVRVDVVLPLVAAGGELVP